METFKKIWSFFFPTWEVIGIYHYIDISYDSDGYESTKVVYKSSNGTIKKKLYYAHGYLSKEDLKNTHP